MINIDEVYPDVKVETILVDQRTSLDYENIIVRMWSKLRVYHMGVWYYTLFYREVRCMNIVQMPKMLTRFHYDVYMFMHFGVVDLTMKDMNGECLFEECEDQSDESERLKRENPQFFYKP